MYIDCCCCYHDKATSTLSISENTHTDPISSVYMGRRAHGATLPCTLHSCICVLIEEAILLFLHVNNAIGIDKKKRQITHYNPSHRNCLLVFSRCNLHAITQQPNNKIDARQQQQNRERIEEKNKCERNRNGLANAKGNECLSTFSLLLRGLFCWFFLLLFVVVVAALWCRQQWQFVHLHRCTVVRMAPYAVLWLLAAIAMHHPSTSTPLACDRFVLTSLLICSVW